MRHRITARWRLTLICGGLAAGVGAVLVTVVYLFMRYVPTYAFTGSPAVDLAPAQASTNLTFSTDAHPISSTLTLTNSTDLLATLLRISLGALLVLTVLGGPTGWFLAGRMLRPLQQITAAARRAGAGDLSGRVGLTGPRDEFVQLSETFDDMLNRLESSFQASERFAANASHELRTPLATTKTMLDVTLADPTTDADTLRALALRVRQTNDRSIDTVEALLDLSSVSAQPLDPVPVRLDSVVADAWSEVSAEAAGLTVTMDVAPATVAGSPVLLRQLAANLLRNAVRHNVPGGRVTVSVSGPTLEVGNTGPMVADVDTLTEPFVRGAGRVARGGHGLGLALVRSIVDAHHGDMSTTANPEGGLTVRVTFQPSTGACGGAGTKNGTVQSALDSPSIRARHTSTRPGGSGSPVLK